MKHLSVQWLWERELQLWACLPGPRDLKIWGGLLRLTANLLRALWICPLGFCFPPDAPVGSRKKPVEKCLLIPYPGKLQDFANQPYKS